MPPETPAVVALPVRRWVAGVAEPAPDEVAEEAPVALRYAGVPHVVMLATPQDLEDLAVGFTLTEQLVTAPAEILAVAVRRTTPVAVQDPVAEIDIDIRSDRLAEVLRRRRHLASGSGCGLCGVESAAQWARTPGVPAAALRLSPGELHAQLAALQAAQVLGQRTGSLHAAAWFVPGEALRCVREDVGRHNAVDKVLGAVVRAGESPARGCLLVTSRASFELVQKALALGVGLLAAVSAPTALAVRAAAAGGLTLVGFARPGRHVVYTDAAGRMGEA